MRVSSACSNQADVRVCVSCLPQVAGRVGHARSPDLLTHRTRYPETTPYEGF